MKIIFLLATSVLSFSLVASAQEKIATDDKPIQSHEQDKKSNAPVVKPAAVLSPTPTGTGAVEEREENQLPIENKIAVSDPGMPAEKTEKNVSTTRKPASSTPAKKRNTNNQNVSPK